MTPENAPRDAWAPDLSWSGTEWRLYYAVSQFGTNNSVIGLLTSPSLADPQWEDRGLVVRSQPGVDTFNAIDPNIVTDADGGDVALVRLVLLRHPPRAGRRGHREGGRGRAARRDRAAHSSPRTPRRTRRSRGTTATTTSSSRGTTAAAAWRATTARWSAVAEHHRPLRRCRRRAAARRQGRHRGHARLQRVRRGRRSRPADGEGRANRVRRQPLLRRDRRRRPATERPHPDLGT